MKLKKLLALTMTATMVASMVGCGSSAADGTVSEPAETEETEVTEDEEAAEDTTDEAADETADTGTVKYADITLGEDYTDLTTTIKYLNHRTDMAEADYAGKNWDAYIAAFNEMYPNITVEMETMTTYADDALLRLQDENWGDIMNIPAVSKGDLSAYYLPYGDLESVSAQCNYVANWLYDGQVYGIPTTANAQGVIYNKKVFEEAGITTLPKTPEEFIADLQLVKEKTDAIPLYTNYAAEWTMGAWDAYISGSATGQEDYMNHELLHTAAPFADPGDGTHAYNVYKVLYDAVAGGLIEDDYTTTDWEGCKARINNGEIATMVLGSWAVSQMQSAGDNADDIGYMSFPITIDGKQYASAGPDYNFGINVNSSPENQAAAMVFVKWMVEESGFSFNEGGLPLKVGDTNLPALYAEFDGVEFIADIPAAEGEEDYLNLLNSTSELMVNQGGNQKIMTIVEHAANDDMSFDDLMQEWNDKWAAAQEAEGIEATK